MDERGGEEDEEEEELARIHRCDRTEQDGRQASNNCINSRELIQSATNQLCDDVLDVGVRRGDLEHQPTGRELLLSPVIPTDTPSLDLELQWQDLMAIMEPEDTDVDMMRLFTLDIGTSGPIQDSSFEAVHQQNCNLNSSIQQADQHVFMMEAHLQHGLLKPPNDSEPESPLLPLTPSAELDGHSSDYTRYTLENLNMNPLVNLPHHMDLLAEDSSNGFYLGLDTENNTSVFNMDLLTEGLSANMEPSYSAYHENQNSFDADFHPRDFTSSTPSLELDGMTHDLPTSPSSVFLVDEIEDEDEDHLSNPLTDLLDSAIFDEMNLLDLALEEGFSPEMATRLQEEGYFDYEMTQQETPPFSHNMANMEDRHHGQTASRTATTEERGYLRSHHQDIEDEDSDSGLSLNFTHSPASPCASEASSYSSSSSSASSSVLAVGSPFSEEEDAEEGLVDSDMEVEVTIKQEEQEEEEEEEEEEMGAAGGGYCKDVKLFFSSCQDQKLFNGFPWLEHVDHDHTYNQAWSPASCPSLPKMPTKHPKSSLRYDTTNPYRRSSPKHISETKMWSRDERRARDMTIPFSTELIINLPVEDFNELLASHDLSEEQLSLVRDIRRRGKNKIAAQNCRRRKLDVLLELEDAISGLRRQRSRLLREKQEALRTLQEMKRRLDMLQQEVFSTLRDEEGRPLDAAENVLHFGPNGSITVASRQQRAMLPPTGERISKKQRNKKK
ncbi:hypothetical protein LDENG_00110910 [Lucifuga dentata]|nr:hypothetical protein LDENG_00110910 [Lucifuga dentata]